MLDESLVQLMQDVGSDGVKYVTMRQVFPERMIEGDSCTATGLSKLVWIFIYAFRRKVSAGSEGEFRVAWIQEVLMVSNLSLTRGFGQKPVGLLSPLQAHKPKGFKVS